MIHERPFRMKSWRLHVVYDQRPRDISSHFAVVTMDSQGTFMTQGEKIMSCGVRLRLISPNLPVKYQACFMKVGKEHTIGMSFEPYRKILVLYDCSILLSLFSLPLWYILLGHPSSHLHSHIKSSSMTVIWYNGWVGSSWVFGSSCFYVCTCTDIFIFKFRRSKCKARVGRRHYKKL